MKYLPFHRLIYAIAACVAGVFLVSGYVYALFALSITKNERLRAAEEFRAITEENPLRGSGEVIRKYFVPDGEEALTVSSLESTCAGFGLVCETLSVEKSNVQNDVPGLSVLTLTIIASGSFDQIMSFLAYLENAELPLSVSGVSFTRDDVWKGQFTISAPSVPR